MTFTKKLPPLHDIVRLLRSSEPEMIEALEQYSQHVGGFNYAFAQKLSANAFSRSIPLSALLNACSGLNPKAARKPNREVLEAVYKSGEGRHVTTYEIAPRVLRLRRDIEIKLNPTFAFVEESRPSLFCLQPRRGFALNLDQLGIYVSIFKVAFLVEDFDGFGLELLDLSVPSGERERVPVTYRLGDLAILERPEIEHLLGGFLRAFDKAEMRPRPRKRLRNDDRDSQLGIDM